MVYVCGGHIMRLLQEGSSVRAHDLPFIQVERWKDAESQGWTVSLDEHTGREIHLCPECSEREADR